MTTLKDAVQIDLQYSAWATRTLLAACDSLTSDEQHRDLGVSHGSVLRTLHHIYVAERFWIGCVLADRIPPLGDFVNELASPELPFAELGQLWPAIWASIDGWLATASDETLSQTVLLTISSESRFDCPRWQILRHVVNHATLHRGQILIMLRALGKKPPCVDYLEYHLRERNLL
jgi:uncharacterized damage-inducible protein DinB